MSGSKWKSLGTLEELQAKYAKLPAATRKKVTFEQWATAQLAAQLAAHIEAPKQKPSPAKPTRVREKPDPAPRQIAKNAVQAEDEDVDDLVRGVMMSDMKRFGLTLRQYKFCHYYMEKDNATLAVIKAGFTQKYEAARVYGSILKTRKPIQDYLAHLGTICLEKLDIGHDKILREYAAMAFANLQDFMTIDKDGLPVVDMSAVTREELAGLAGIEVVQLPPMEEDGPSPLRVKIKLANKQAALDVLAKRAGLLKEKMEVHHTGLDLNIQDLATRMAFLMRKAAVAKNDKPA